MHAATRCCCGQSRCITPLCHTRNVFRLVCTSHVPRRAGDVKGKGGGEGGLPLMHISSIWLISCKVRTTGSITKFIVPPLGGEGATFGAAHTPQPTTHTTPHTAGAVWTFRHRVKKQIMLTGFVVSIIIECTSVAPLPQIEATSSL